MNKKTIDKLALLIFSEGAVLFAVTRGQTLAYTIGGKRHAGETDMQALSREVLEETGAILDISSVGHVLTLTGPAHGQAEGTLVQLACFTGELDREPKASSEIERFVLLYADDKHLTTEIGAVLLDQLHERGLIRNRTDATQS